MKKKMKLLSAAVLLAALVPVSAYAAETTSTTPTTSTPGVHNKSDKTVHLIQDKWGKNEGLFKKEISEELAAVLKLDAATIKSRISQGETLAQIAEKQGVSKDDLKNALIKANNETLDKAKTKFANSVDKLINEKHPNREQHKSAIRMDFKEIGTLLGMSDADFKQAVKSGKSVADLAKEKNVELQKLVDAQVSELMKHVEEQVQSGKITKEQADKRKASFTQMVTKMFEDKAHKGQHAVTKPVTQ
ncbi:LysM peptidoglycan-binding domain-containing protein [Paenibacillus sp. N1-5-1-14]|uniref:LysM peptidoglycan-binding domain-containing protein n=1 Tax=Paenibacillus radicibacter TaxID=2972488 RepID=UPI002158DFC5|nr:LysM peptidoglycan-binding domain-containing protein [Paenibacillus radicibacter]MCR8644197.1 LysM peptidoglycan-binding domain-containing protein [Paenibacillus radicibacter]